jgi:transitional endoplasmic reticulum ATPase
MLSKWVGESAKAVREIFKKARQTSPTIVFFDEIDSIAAKRGMGENKESESVINQLLTELGGLQDMKGVVVLASTNRPDIIDSALLRPGRFDRIIYASVPDEKARAKIFHIHLKMKLDIPLETTKKETLAKELATKTEEEIKRDRLSKELATKTEGYVGADIEAVCREAAMLALRENNEATSVSKKHFTAALEKIKPSVTKDLEETYSSMESTFRQATAKEVKQNRPTYYG